MNDRNRAENLCEALLEQASDGIFLADATTRYVLVNDQACRMLGYSREELLQLYMRDLVASEDTASTPMRLDELRAGKTLFSERHLVRKDGTRVLVELSAKMLADGHLQAIARDITERKQAELHIRKVDRAYALLSDVNQAIVRIRERKVLLDRICEIAVQVSNFRMAWIGLVDETSQRTDVVAKAGGSEYYFEQLAVSLRAETLAYNPSQRALDSGQHISCNRIGHDIPLEPCQDLEIQLGIMSSAAFPLIVSGKVCGTLNFYSDQPDFFDGDEIKLLSELAMDISFAIEFGDEDDKRRRAERALADSEARFRATFEQAAVGIVHVAPDGRLLRVNQRLCEIVGYTRAELLERTFQDITYADDLATDLEYVRQVLANQIQTYSMEKRYICKDGRLVWINLTVSLVRDADGSPDYFISVVEDISSRKQAEDQIRSLAKFPMENPSPVIRLRQDGLILYANDASHWLLEEWECTVDSYAPAFWRDLVSAALLSHSVMSQELQYRDEVWSFWLAPVPQEVYVNLYGRDITEREQAARKRAELAAIVESSDDAIIGKTLDGIVTSWNRGAEQIYGYTQDEIIGKPIAILVPPGYEDDESRILEKIRSGTPVEHYETTRQRKDGKLIQVATSVSPIGDQGGRVVAASAISRDVTERQRSQEALRRYAERLAAINRLDRLISSQFELDQIYDGFVTELHALVPLDRTAIVELDEAGDQWQIVRQWTAHQPLFTPGEWHPVQGSVIEWLVTHRIPFFEREVGERGTWPETALLKQEGIRSRWLFPLIIEGRVAGLLSIASRQPDVYSEDDQAILIAVADQLAIALHNAQLYEQVKRHSVELEQRVLQRTAALEASNKELEAFSYSVSHDLRAPLRAMDGFSRILLDEYSSALPNDAQRYLGLVRENAQQMGKLIDHLLAFSRLGRQSLKKDSVLPATLARAVMADLLAQEADRRIEVTIADLPPCQADPTLLRQVFVNLLGNAIKFTKTRTEAKIEVGYLEQAGQPVYFVKDNGVGFDMRYIDKLFGVFQRLHRAEDFEGTGVGLATVQRIIHRHGGRIWAEAVLNQGATFYFNLEGEEHDGA